VDPQAVKKELQYRIQADIAHHGGKLPDRVSIAWRSYLAGLVEWSIIGRSDLEALIDLLPQVRDDPTQAILSGRPLPRRNSR